MRGGGGNRPGGSGSTRRSRQRRRQLNKRRAGSKAVVVRFVFPVQTTSRKLAYDPLELLDIEALMVSVVTFPRDPTLREKAAAASSSSDSEMVT
jgi:hypothetical protein